MSERVLPDAKSTRWQLLRSGLINLFHYADEEFWYEDGRLLLRGNNGTGKSRVLALQLPFLLDAELNPTRMEPDRSPSKRPEWNLLLGGKHRDRIGYTFLELGRVDSDGTPHYFTIGCGMHAVKDRGRMDAWFFTTKQRVGRDLELVVDRVPRSKTGLAEAIDESGQIYRTQSEYRAAVDDHLFRLADRYRTLVDLLIQLRVPQLSRDFDEKRINAQLSDALPPLSSDVLTQVADAMRDLDEQRQRLEESRRSARAVDEFSRHYAGYLEIALRRRVNLFFEKHNQYDRLQRKINEHVRSLDDATDRVTVIENATSSAKDVAAQTQAELDVLQDRPEIQDSQRLNRMQEECEKLKRQCEQTRQLLQTESEQAAENTEHVRRLDESWKWERKALRTRTDELAVRPAPPTLMDALSSAVTVLENDQIDLRPLKSIERTLAQIEPSIDALKQLVEVLRTSQSELERGLDRQSEHERRCETAREAVKTTLSQLKLARTELCLRWQQWHDDSHTAIPDIPAKDEFVFMLDFASEEDTDRVGSDDDDWFTSPNVSVAKLAENAIDEASAITRNRLATLRQDLTRINDDITAATDRMQQLQSGLHVPPPVPHPRDEAARNDREGAPLYQLVEFVDAVPESERGCWEAGLEASGLLDAWVLPDGSLAPLSDDKMLGDVFACVDTSAPDMESSMTEILRPADSLPEPIAADQVHALLHRLGCGRDAGIVWFDRDGSWRIGPKHGVWQKHSAEHIGMTARETRRQTLMAELHQQIERLQTERNETQAKLDGEDVRLESIQKTRSDLPDDAVFLRSVAQHEAMTARQVEDDESLRAQITVVGKLRDQRNARASELDRTANDFGLSDWKDRLDDLRDCLRDIRNEVDSLRFRLGAFVQQIETLKRAWQNAHDARQRVENRTTQLADLDREHGASQKAFTTLKENVGEDVQRVLDQIHDAKRRGIEAEQRIEALGNDRLEATKSQSKLEGKIEEARQTLDNHEADRRDRIAALQWFADSDLLPQTRIEIECPPIPWSPTRALGVAKEMRDSLDKVRDTDQAWENVQNELNLQFKTLEQTLLPTGMTPYMQSKGDVLVFHVPYHGVEQSPLGLAQWMADEVRSRDALITQQERQLFEERLVGDIALALHQNIRSAHQMCKTMNAEVESRPMSTGMRLRFRWQPQQDANDELKTACQALLKQPAAMNETEQASLGEFLQNRIAEARTRDDAGTWQQHLADALDYRTWFAFQIDRQTDNRWERLTRRTHGTGSGGERAVALIMPMLAALAAYYHSADPTAPRLILMDEAYVGIDNEMRAKFMDLLVQFDLDFIMTSEREWGCYPTMPSLAIYHLATRPGIDAVLPTRWVWNGVRRQQSLVHEPARAQDLFDDAT